MKQLVLAVLLSLFALSSAKAQVLNGDFESWTGGKPTDWLPVDTMGSYSQDIDTSDGSACFSYSDSHVGRGTYLTFILQNTTLSHPYGSVIPPGQRVLTVHYQHDCQPQSGYITLAYILHDRNGTITYAGSQILTPSAWRKAQLRIPEIAGATDTEYAQIQFKFSFATQQADGQYQYILSVDNVGFDSVLDAGVALHSYSVPFAAMVFPNPASSHTMVELPVDASEPRCTLFDAAGRTSIPSSNFSGSGAGYESFDVSNIPNGMYFLKISTPAGAMIRPVIVRH